MSYNINDYQPKAGKEIKSDGTVVYLENSEGVLLPSATRSATTDTTNQINYNARGVILFLNVTSIGTGSLTAKIRIIDPVSNALSSIAATNTISAIGLYILEVYPGATASGATSFALPKRWIAEVTHADSSNWTYSLGYSLIE